MRASRWQSLGRLALVGLLILPGMLHLALIATDLTGYVAHGPFDWNTFRAAAERIASGADPYVRLTEGTSTSFRWSPLAAWLLVPITAIPWPAWTALHLAALAALRDWRLIAVVALSWPFVLDALDGGVMIFVAVTAYWAIRGSRPAGIAFLVITLLVPRVLMLPVAAWLLWTRPAWRIPFLVAVLAHGIAVVATGWHVAWADRLLGLTGEEMAVAYNLAPSRWIGTAWIPAGLALAGLAAWRGRLGLASVLASPYVFPPYLLMLVLEWPSAVRGGRGVAWRERDDEPAVGGEPGLRDRAAPVVPLTGGTDAP